MVPIIKFPFGKSKGPERENWLIMRASVYFTHLIMGELGNHASENELPDSESQTGGLPEEALAGHRFSAGCRADAGRTHLHVAVMTSPPEAWAEASAKIAEECNGFADALESMCDTL